MKKLSFPKIQIPFQKKKTLEPVWKISTKIAESEEVFTRSRDNQKPWGERVSRVFMWVKNYIKTVGWVFLGGLIMVGMIVLFATPIFSLKPDNIVVILKPEPVFDAGAINSILGDFAGKNIFSITTQEVFSALSENIRHIASVEKSLMLPDGMRVTVTSFPASYRAFIGEERFLLTENGQLITDIPEVEAPALQIYHLVQDPNIGKNTPIIDEDMYGIRLILNAWKKHMSTAPIEEMRFYEQEKELHIVTGKTRIIFLLENGAQQVILLQKLIEQGHVILSRLTYIDVRITHRLYTCARAENICASNLRELYEN